jgi:hypothetical protein
MTRQEQAAVTDRLRDALLAYPTVMGVGAAYYPALAAVLRQAVTDAELRRRLGMTMPPPGAMI